MYPKWLNLCLKHKLVHHIMQALKSGKISHMIKNQISGLWVVYSMK